MVLLLLAAFEFQPGSGPAGAMLAGAAAAEWQHCPTHNPALCICAGRFAAGAEYCRPFGLDRVNWVRFGSAVSNRQWGGGFGLSSLGFGGYRETDLVIDLAAEPLPQARIGVGLHLMVLDQGLGPVDAVPSFDLGLLWRSGAFSLAGAGLNINQPRLRSGAEVPMRLILGGAVRPVESLLLALDLTRTGDSEGAAFGAEFRLAPPLDLRVGLAYPPLGYGAGLGARVGILEVDYAYRFHPQLKETHLFGVRVGWD